MKDRRSISLKTRMAVLTRDGFRCRRCGRAAPDVVLHVDHVKPHSAGGSDHEDNLQALCGECNASKGASAPHPHDGSKRVKAAPLVIPTPTQEWPLLGFYVVFPAFTDSKYSSYSGQIMAFLDLNHIVVDFFHALDGYCTHSEILTVAELKPAKLCRDRETYEHQMQRMGQQIAQHWKKGESA